MKSRRISGSQNNRNSNILVQTRKKPHRQQLHYQHIIKQIEFTEEENKREDALNDQYKKTTNAGGVGACKDAVSFGSDGPDEEEEDPADFFDKIPSEPVNIALADKKKALEDLYSYNKATGTLPYDRVKYEPQPRYLIEIQKKKKLARSKSRSKSPPQQHQTIV